MAIHQLQLTNSDAKSIDGFLAIGFTHHCIILAGAKTLEERLFYIRKCATEHLSVAALKRSLKAEDYRHQGAAPNNFLATLPKSQQALRAITAFKDEHLLVYMIQDYSRPMGVATYKTSKDMPEKLLNVLPPIDELKALLEGAEM